VPGVESRAAKSAAIAPDYWAWAIASRLGMAIEDEGLFLLSRISRETDGIFGDRDRP